MFFHPRDWVDVLFGSEPENDAEGLLLTVARDGSTYGALKSAVTVADSDCWSYLAPGRRTGPANRESVDGTLRSRRFRATRTRSPPSRRKGTGSRHGAIRRHRRRRRLFSVARHGGGSVDPRRSQRAVQADRHLRARRAMGQPEHRVAISPVRLVRGRPHRRLRPGHAGRLQPERGEPAMGLG